MHDEDGSLPSSLGLNAIPKTHVNRFVCVREPNKHCLEMDFGVIRALHLLPCAKIYHIIAVSLTEHAGL